MYKKILLPVAEDEGARTDEVIKIATALCAEEREITVMHVMEALPAMAKANLPSEVTKQLRTDATTMLGIIAARCGEGTHSVLVNGHGGRTIVNYAADHEIDCIVMRSHRPVFEDILFGSTAAYVVGHAACSVHVLR
ncbi:MAG: universal stress protein [Pseudomonadota bacterium]